MISTFRKLLASSAISALASLVPLVACAQVVIPGTAPANVQQSLQNLAAGGVGGSTISSVAGDLTGTIAAGVLTLTLPNVNSLGAGTCGDATHVGQLTTTAKGLATNCVPIAIPLGTTTVPGLLRTTDAPVQSVAGLIGSISVASLVAAAGGTTAGTFAKADDTRITTAASTTYVNSQGFVNAAQAASAAPVPSVAGRTGPIALAVTDIAGAAPLNNAALTGVPTTPTAAPGTTGTQISSVGFVGAAITAAGTGGAPINSPTFTGNVNIPTYAAASNSTLAASTNYVDRAITTAGTGTGVSQASIAHYGGVSNVYDGNAYCDGTSRTAGATLGLTTIALLTGYTNALGQHPYSWYNNGNADYWANLEVQGNHGPGKTVLFIDGPASGIPNGASISSPNGAVSSTVASTQDISPVSQTSNGGGTAGSYTINFPSTSGIWVGELLPTMQGVPANDVITNVTATQLTVANSFQGNGTPSGTVFAFPRGGVINLTSATTGTLVGRLTGGDYTSNANGSSMLRIHKAATDASASSAQLDWLAIQSGIQTAAASTTGTGGGTVTIPVGKCMMDGAADVGTGNGTLVIPASGEDIFYSNGNPVDIVGKGKFTTRLTWPTDLGMGRMGIVTGAPGDNWPAGNGRFGYNYYTGQIRDLMLAGPGNGNQHFGQRQAFMDGAVLGARRAMTRVFIRDWNAGWSQDGDHTLYTDVTSTYNYCGLREADGSTSLYGDFIYNHVMLDGNHLANICVSKNSTIGGVWDKPYLGGSPYSILAEAGAPDLYNEVGGYSGNVGLPATNAMTITHAQLEWVGDAEWIDDNITRADGTDGGTMVRDFTTTTCEKCYVSTNTNNSITNTTAGYTTGRNLRHYFVARNFNDIAFTHMNGGSAINSGLTSLMYKSGTIYGFQYDGDPSNFTGDNSNLLQGNIGPYNAADWKNMELSIPTRWTGNAEFIAQGGTVNLVKGMILEQQANVTGSQIGTASNNLISGVMEQNYLNASGAVVAVATKGRAVDVAVDNSGLAPGAFLKKNGVGGATVATGPGDVGYIGVISSWQDGNVTIGGVTYTLFPVTLKAGA